MRKLTFFIAFFIFLGTAAWGQTVYIWSGDVDSAWNNPENWGLPPLAPNPHPVDGDSVTIPSGCPHYPVVPSGSTLILSDLTVADGWLDTTGADVSVTGDAEITGTLTLTGTLDISGNLDVSLGSFSGGIINFWGGIISASVPDILIEDITGTSGTLTAGSKNVDISTNSAGAATTVDVDLIISSGQKNLTAHGTQNLIIISSGSQFNNIILTGIITTGGNLHASTLTVNSGAELILNADASGIGTLNNNGTLELAGHDLSVTTSLVNNNLIRLDGIAYQSVSSFSGNGTAEFSASGVSLAGITSFHNLTILGGTRSTAAVSVSGNFEQIAGSLTIIAPNALTMTGASMRANSITGNVIIDSALTASGGINVAGLLTINAGRSLDMASHNLSVSSLTITGTLTSGVQITLNGGTWNRTGTFNHNNGDIILNNNTNVNNSNIFHNVTCNGTVDFTGDNTIANLTCGSGSTVSFAGGSTQIISVLTAGSAVLTAIASASQWNLSGLTETNITTTTSTNISYCKSDIYLARNSGNAVNGGNNIRVFAGGTFVWTGDTSTVWRLDGNWNPYFPPVTDNTTIITIPDISAGSARYPALEAAVVCGALTIDTGAEMDLGVNNLTVNGTLANNGSLNLRAANLFTGTLTNSGTITLTGTQSITGQGAAVGGTVCYHGNAVSPWILGNNYTNLVVDPGLLMGAAGGALTVTGTAEINSNISAVSINVSGHSTLNANISTSLNQNYSGISYNNQIILTSGSGSVTASGKVTGSSGITINASQGITLNNSVNEISGNVALNNNQTGITPANAVNFHTSENATVSGVNNYGNFNITADGIIANGITANGHTVLLASAAPVTQTAAIICDTLILYGNTNFSLNNPANNVTIIETDAVYFPASIGYTDANAFSIGAGGLRTSAAGSITLHASGLINQNGTIVTETLSIATTTAGAITLNTQNNNVQKLQITGSAGVVNFRNSNDLEITGINGVNNNNVSINAAGGDLIVSGAVSNVGILTLNSDNDLIITAAGNISSTNRAVLSAATAAVNGNITVTGNGSEASAAIHVTAGIFTGTGQMTPGTGTVCVYLSLTTTYTGSVTGNPIHYHAVGKHIVYRNGSDSSGYSGINGGDTVAAGSYIYIQAELNLGPRLNLFTSGNNYNIFIIDVGNAANANTREVAFTSEGYIEIRGAYTSSQTLNLSGNVRLNNNQADSAPCALVLPSFNITAPLVLYGGTGAAASIRAAAGNISLGTVNGTAAGSNNLHLEISGNTNTFTAGSIGAVTALGDIQLVSVNNAPGAVSFNGTINAGSYTQTGTGSSHFSGIQNYSGDFAFTGAALTVSAALNAANITITNSGLFTLGTNSTMTLSGNFTQNGAGTNTIASNITSANNTAANTILFTASVALAANAGNLITFNVQNNSTVRFNGAVSCSVTPAVALTINGNAHLNAGSADIGAVIISRDANFSNSQINAVSVRVTGTSTVNTNIHTSGEQNYTAVVVGNVTPVPALTSSASRVIASGVVSSAAGNTGLTVYASSGIDLSNTGNTLSGNINLYNNQGAASSIINFNSLNPVTVNAVNNSAAAGNNVIRGGTITVGNTGILLTAGNIELNSAGFISIGIGGGISTAGNVNLISGSTVTQSGIINAANLTVSASGITLGGANQINASAAFTNTTAGDIVFVNTAAINLSLHASNSGSGGTISVAHNNGILTVNTNSVTSTAGAITLSGFGGITINGAVNTQTGAAINLSSSNGNITGGGAVTGTNLNLTANAGSINLTGVITGTIFTASAANGITLNGGNHVSASASFNNTSSGNIAFTNNTPAAVTLDLHASNSVSGGTINVAHNNGILNVINTGVTSTAGAIAISGSARITVNGVISTGSGAAVGLLSNGYITGGGAITGTALNLTASAGEINLTGVLTGANLTINAGGAITASNIFNNISAARITNTGGAVVFNNSIALDIQEITAGNHNVEINNAHNINITGAVTTNNLTLRTNNNGVNNDITISAAMTIDGKLTIICGYFTPADDLCGIITINNIISAGAGTTGEVVVIETGNIKNYATLNAAGKNISIKTDEFDDYGNINAANVSISPRHRENINLVYYSGTPPAFSDIHFGDFFAVPALGTDNKNFSGYENVFFVNVNDSANRTVNINARGFVEFYTSDAYSSNSYTYNGSHSDHLKLNIVNIHSYHADYGQANVNLGSSVFNVSQNIYMERGSLLIKANGMTLGGNVTSAAGAPVKNLRLESSEASHIRAVNVSGNFEFSGTSLVIDGIVTAGGNFEFSGSTLNANRVINAVDAVIVNSGVFTLPSGSHITLSGNFSQSGGGTSSLSANIITSGNNASISFVNPVVIGNSITLQNENGIISIGNAINGSAFALHVNSGGTVTFANTVNLAGFTMNKVGVTFGNARFYNTQDYAGNFIFYGGELTIDGTMTAGGSVQITNSELFTTSADIISGSGFTQHTESAGASVLGGNITTQGTIIIFVNNVSLASDVQLSTVSGNSGGNISLTGIEGAGRNLIMSVNTAEITVSGSIGNAGAIGSIRIVRANDAIFSGSVNAVSFTQEACSSHTTFDGAQNYSAGFSFAGVNLTVNNDLNTDTDTTNDDGAVSVTNSGLFTVGVTGAIAPNGMSGTLKVTGNTQNNGKITAGPVSPAGIAVDFYGNYTASANGELAGNAAADPGIQFRQNVILGTHTHNNNRLIFAESALSHELSVVSSVTPVFADVIIRQGNKVALNNSDIKQADGKALMLENNAELDLSSGSWHIGVSESPSNDLAGINGELILGAGSKLFLNNLNFTGEAAPSASFTVKNTLGATINITGNVDISSNVTIDGGGNDNFPLLLFEMEGNGLQYLTADLMLGSLHVKENSRTVLNVRNTNSSLPEENTVYFRGEVKIFALSAPLGLEAEDLNIVMYSGLKGKRDKSAYMHDGNNDIYYTRWEVTNAKYISQPPFVVLPDIENFVFRQKPGNKISFRKDISDLSADSVFFEIAGNTMWQEFECIEPGAFIQFSRYPDHHTVLDNFRITGNEIADAPDDHSKYVTITRLTDGGYDYPYEYAPSMGRPPSPTDANIVGAYALPVYLPPMDLKNAVEAERQKYWNINLVSSPNPAYRPLEGFSYVRIYFSHAYNQRIPIVAKEMHLDVNPYWRDENLAAIPPVLCEGYFNFDWVELRKILYSFTEDSNGNGRLDRIRIQTNISLNGNFSKFDIEVEGYKVDDSKYNRGYQMVNDFTGTGEFDTDSFYVYLVEDSEVDSGNTPVWHVRFNESLMDALTGTQVGDPAIDVNIKPFDTIPPRIAYSLTLPSHPQTYVRMSEPVVSGSVSGTSSFNNSEIIETTPPYTFMWQYFPFEDNRQPVEKKMPVDQANLGYFLNWNNPFSVVDLAKLNNLHTDTTSTLEDGYFQIDNVYDQGQRAMDWSDHKLDEAFYIFYQPPKYPINWKYTAYAKVMGNKHLMSPAEGTALSDDEPLATIASLSGIGTIPVTDVFLPPNKMLTVEMMTAIANGDGDKITPSSFASYSGADDIVIRRVTDALVSIPPWNSGSADYFAWPVWARYQEEPNADGYSDNNDFWGMKYTDTGIIWEFDGTKYLEADSIDIQSRVNTVLGNFNLELFWTTNIPAKFRIPKESPLRGRSSGGLWLPYPADLHNNRLLYYYAPLFKEDDKIGQIPASSTNLPLVNFKLSDNTPPGFSSGNKVEFVYRLLNNSNPSVLSDMFIARLDIPRGGVIPANWHRLVKTFSFDIQNIRHQRGGVTILNNVINSEKREVTYIRYQLARPGRVTIQVYTLDGTLIKSIRRNEHRGAGEYTDSWDGSNNGGRPVARGMYFVRVVAPDIDEIRKIMVVK